MSQTILSLPGRGPARPSWRLALRDAAARAWARVEAARGLREAAELDDRGLRDLGLSRAQAQAMTDGPVWELVPFLHR